MKQKYTVVKNDETNELIIREYGELDKEVLSLLCEERFDIDKLRDVLPKGRQLMVKTIRTVNMFPPSSYAERLAASVITVLQDETDQPVEIVFEDLDLINKNFKDFEEEEEEVEDEPADIDELLDEDIDAIENEFDSKTSLNNLNSPLRISDEDSLDIEDES